MFLQSHHVFWHFWQCRIKCFRTILIHASSIGSHTIAQPADDWGAKLQDEDDWDEITQYSKYVLAVCQTKGYISIYITCISNFVNRFVVCESKACLRPLQFVCNLWSAAAHQSGSQFLDRRFNEAAAVSAVRRDAGVEAASFLAAQLHRATKSKTCAMNECNLDLRCMFLMRSDTIHGTRWYI